MEKIGTVIAILNDEFLIVKLNRRVDKHTIVDIYGTVNKVRIDDNTLINDLVIDKGKIEILTEQEHMLYLGKRFKEKKEVTHWGDNLPTTGIGSLLRKNIIREEIEVGWSAQFDRSGGLNLTINKSITAGDIVGVD